MSEHDGMPCGVYVSQFTLQALYKNAADHRDDQAALELLTSTAKNSWLNMLREKLLLRVLRMMRTMRVTRMMRMRKKRRGKTRNWV